MDNKFRKKMIDHGRERYPTFNPEGHDNDALENRLTHASENASPGPWRQGLTSHETIVDREDARHVADFRHADDAAFVDLIVNLYRAGRIAIVEKSEDVKRKNA